VIELRGVTKIYDLGGVTVNALAGVDVRVEKGEFVAVMGPSGSGKSTFMSIVGLLDRPTAGSYELNGVDAGKMSRDDMAELRNRALGFVFQGFNLLQRTSAVENVELPMTYAGVHTKERRERALDALAEVGLAERAGHFPNQLSGGQQQRVAIARALVNKPNLILADEPTGNLDTRTSVEVMELFQKLNAERGITLVIVTHEHDISTYAKRRIFFRDGLIESDEKAESPTSPLKADMR